MSKKRKGKTVIPVKNMGSGVRKTWEHIESSLEIAKELHKEKHYKASIPISILMIEENTKLVVLGKHWLYGDPVTKEVYEKLRDHEYKQNELIRETIEAFETTGSGDKNDIDRLKEKEEKINKKFEWLKELCFYPSFDGKEWKIFEDFNEDEQRSISQYVLTESIIAFYKTRIRLHQFHLEKDILDKHKDIILGIDTLYDNILEEIKEYKDHGDYNVGSDLISTLPFDTFPMK